MALPRGVDNNGPAIPGKDQDRCACLTVRSRRWRGLATHRGAIQARARLSVATTFAGTLPQDSTRRLNGNRGWNPPGRPRLGRFFGQFRFKDAVVGRLPTWAWSAGRRPATPREENSTVLSCNLAVSCRRTRDRGGGSQSIGRGRAAQRDPPFPGSGLPV